MRKDIHPKMFKVVAKCACGAEYEIETSQESLRLDICAKCHPFYTGKQKIVDTAGRVEKFKRRYENSGYNKKK
jgi:large subunit ribosomal protein L31